MRQCKGVFFLKKLLTFFISLSLLLVFAVALLSGMYINYTSSVVLSGKGIAVGINTSIHDGKLDINTATANELAHLPRIGEAIAQRIVEYRQANGSFQCIDDLLNIKGIGSKTLEELEPYIRIGD